MTATPAAWPCPITPETSSTPAGRTTHSDAPCQRRVQSVSWPALMAGSSSTCAPPTVARSDARRSDAAEVIGDMLPRRAGLHSPVVSERWATFDCYGTLIDWMGGIRATLASLWPDADADDLLRIYHRIEPAVQAREPMSYRRVMAEVLWRVAALERLVIPDVRADALA